MTLRRSMIDYPADVQRADLYYASKVGPPRPSTVPSRRGWATAQAFGGLIDV